MTVENYPYRTYAYHDKGPVPVPGGTYLILNNDPNGAAEIEYGACVSVSTHEQCFQPTPCDDS